MTRALAATLLFWLLAALCLVFAVYKFSVGAAGSSFRLAALALVAWAIGRYGPWR